MTLPWIHARVRETEIGHLAELIAFALKPGDVVALRGDLGAGKSTLARKMIRVMLRDEEAEVPSPTFSLVQTYATPRFALSHFDLYRVGSADEAYELGLGEYAATRGAALIEWPERAEGLLPADRIEIRLEEDPDHDADERRIVIDGLGTARPRIERLQQIDEFLQHSGWGDARLFYLQGDASARRFGRLVRDGSSVVLMDALPQPDERPVRNGKTYSQIAHLARDLGPWVAITNALTAAELSSPEVIAEDLEAGLLLVEDFGDDTFTAAAERDGRDQAERWRAAVDVLLHLRATPLPQAMTITDGSMHRLQSCDDGVLQIEVELLLDWYWPALHGEPAPDALRTEYLSLWRPVFDALLPMPAGWMLRDFHSPNLMWLPERHDLERVGILDCQDVLQGHPAYDLVSLLQDARVDVAGSLEQQLFAYYCAAASAAETAFDRDAFVFAYAALGAQRNTKVLGIFTRLAMRDGKDGYLRHIPRIWHYLDRNLTHASLRPLKMWYEHNFPAEHRLPPSVSQALLKQTSDTR